MFGFLIVARCTMDDIPIAIVGDYWEARKMVTDEDGRGISREMWKKINDNVFGINPTDLISIEAVRFEHGTFLDSTTLYGV